MNALLLTLALTAAPADGFIVILGGGKSTPDAEAAVRDWVEQAKWKPVVSVEGWPKVIASDEVAGLKPGFQLAVLGVCPTAEAAVAQAAATSTRGPTFAGCPGRSRSPARRCAPSSRCCPWAL